MDLKDKLLEILICPACRGDLAVDENGAVCENCRLFYPFSHGIPAMLAASAIALDDDGNNQ